MKNSNAYNCNLDLETKTVYGDAFCGKGLWIVDGVVMEFKDAFRLLYADKAKEKEIKTREGNDGT
jgi:hypothetical protein